MGLQFYFSDTPTRQIHVRFYTDANFASEGENMKSVISAKCWKQDTLVESSCEVKLLAASSGMQEAVWLEQLVDELGLV
ncbi:hypothetical protein F441_16462 [Phytophthora nicotianae CJ01A1]|uniref:Uncharacterized protein n=6 Tax=Phytophthora nicotianae TaxID=4792 RepID=W2G3S6_PHYNI|nr:hypothetical protein L915_16165 [Phytophthora nicotianae]ETL31031.1 hypothetical protein L916_16062 [Phytophthora nicotianae]ETO66126.1 hypothetical protein F444_16633 [Phytophthora nicotianae P1976]ETP07223.1 hypothetical protein F441_16462 [Phytophthora nicotianae CJ01A1]